MRHLALPLLLLVACKSEPAPPAPETPPPARCAAVTGPGCWSRGACAAGCRDASPSACAALATFQRLGLGAPAPDEPEDALAKACDGGDPEACVRAALDLDPADPRHEPAVARARSLVEAACARGDGEGCIWGAHLERGADNATHVARFVKSCDLGATDACHRLLTYALGVALTHEESLLPEGAERRATATLEKRCAEDDAMACFSLALHGETPERAAARADALFDARCAAGHPPSCALLGSLRRDLRDDPAGAVAAYRRACDGGLVDACGRATPPDPRLSGAFTVTAHVVYADCTGEPEDSVVPIAQLRLEASAPPANPRLEVRRCESTSASAGCDDLAAFDERDGAGWKATHDAVLSGSPCFAATLTTTRIRATSAGLELTIETWITPDGDHPELCASAREGRSDGMTCVSREVVTASRG